MKEIVLIRKLQMNVEESKKTFGDLTNEEIFEELKFQDELHGFM